MNEITPNIVFIIPYRDRQKHYEIFSKQMKIVLEDMEPDSYKLIYVHQTDNRSFNRGAMKNIGFLYVKDKYPNTYNDITLIFNDIDTMPCDKGFLDYKTKNGVISHLYGFSYTLGGIVSVKANDFEKMNGYPNFWAWGYEDNALHARAYKNNIIIDRSKMCKIGDKNISHLKDTYSKRVNKDEWKLYKSSSNEGISDINSLTYNVNESTGFIDVLTFNTNREENITTTKIYDTKNGNIPFRKHSAKMKMTFF